MIQPTPRHIAVAGLTAVLLFVSALAFGQAPAATPAASSPSVGLETANSSDTTSSAGAASAAAIEARMKAVETDGSLAAPDKKTVLETLRQALEFTRAADSWSRKSADIAEVVKNIPTRLTAIKQELAQPTDVGVTDIASTATADQLEQLTVLAETDLAAAQKKAADLRAELSARGTRRASLPKQVTSAKESLEKLGGDTPAAPPSDASSGMAEAGSLLASARRNALQAELAAYEKELAVYDSLTELQSLEADRAARKVEIAQAALTRLRDALAQKRRTEADDAVRAARQARLDAASTSPVLRKLAEENERLAQRRVGLDGLNASIEKTQTEFNNTRQLQSRVQLMMDYLKKRVNAVGNTQAVGLLLRKTLAELPDVADLRSRSNARAEMIIKAQSELLDIDDQRSDLPHLVIQTSEALTGSGTGKAGSSIEYAARELLIQRRTLLDSLSSDLNTWFGALVDLDSLERQVIDQHKAASSYIGQRVLYVQSAAPIGPAEMHRAISNLTALFSPALWRELAGILRGDAKARLDLYLPAMFLLPCLLYYRRRMKKQVASIGEAVLSGGQKTAREGFRALLLTVLIAAPVPAFLYFLAWRMTEAPETGGAGAKAIGAGLRLAATFYLHMYAVQRICMPKGVAEAYLGWSPKRLRLLVRNVKWLLPFTVLVTFQIAALNALAGPTHSQAPGRPVFLMFMVALTIFCRNVFHPSKGVLAGWLEANPGGWVARTRHAWFGLLVGLPVVFMVAAALGYYYTAAVLMGRVMKSALIIFWAFLLREMLLQWVVIAWRSLAQFQAWRQMNAATPEMVEETKARTQVEASALSGRLRRLITMVIGAATVLVLYVHWVEVLPALHMFDRVELWTYTGKVTETITAADGTVRAQTVEKLLPVTLGSLVLAIAVFILTISAARNIPSLLEITVLRRLSIDSGLQYALTTVCRYTISVAGCIMMFQLLGVTWASVQWLAAAVTVGLGFGLQEIFANFVSGLIILFERPIRVGDTITIGDISGTVARVHIRATTIRGWDGKDLIVPNKQIITGNLLNWTLSDSMTRLEFPVAVEYGNDPEKVRSLLLEVADSHPKVLQKPKPAANFMGFGDGALTFKLFAYVADMADRSIVTTEINTQILSRFASAGIAIATARQTLHILTSSDNPAGEDRPNEARKP